MQIKNIDITREDVSMYVPEGENYRLRYNNFFANQSWEDKYEKVHTIRFGKHRFVISILKPFKDSNKKDIKKAA